MTAAHPIDKAWLSTGGTGARNYDEFADDAEITDIVEANPTSMLAVEMPHYTPEARAAGLDFDAALPAAAERLAALEESGRFAAHQDTVVVYRISDGERAAYGMFCLVDTGEISSTADEPGVVIRNEDVFIAKVEQRAALNRTLRHLLSPVLLVQTGTAKELQAELVEVVAGAGAAAVRDVDEAGRRHEIWPIGPGATADRLCRLAGGGELIVADGNHRSLAAQVGELPRFLAVVTTPESVAIQPYHRLLNDLPITPAELLDALGRRGAEVTPVDGAPSTPATGGVVHCYADGQTYAVRFAEVDGSVVDRLDHARVEQEMFNGVLGFDAGDKRIVYVGGDYPPSWLAEQVDSDAAELAVLIAPVTVDDFVAVNLDRLKMPRKSTWFTPKARAGLVLADLG